MNRLQITIAIVVIVIVVLLVILYRTRRVKDEKIPVESDQNSLKSEKKPTLLPPSDIKFTVQDASIKVTWSEVPTAEEYIAYYSNKSDFKKEDARTIAGIDKGEFEINKVPFGKYYFRVASKAGDLESELSEMHTVEVDFCTPVEAPKNVRSKVIQTDSNSFKVLISWQPEIASDGYVIHLNHNKPPAGDKSDYMVIKVKNVDANSHLLEGLESSLRWYATVSCNGAHCGEGLPSESILLNQ